MNKLKIEQHRRISKPSALTLAAVGVHLLTSFGIVCSFLSILKVFAGDLNKAFLWLGVALFIDSIDGSLARKVNVSRFTPNINGLMMDSIVDFINYILIPCLIFYTGGFLLRDFEVFLPAAILVISLFSYSRISVLDDDFRYVGFPVAWNIVAVYLYIFDVSQLANTIIISMFIILKFVPLKYVHPFRTKRHREPTLFFTALWLVSIGVLCLNKALTLDASIIIPANVVLAIATLYFVCLTLASGFEGRAINRKQLSRRSSIPT